MTMVGAVRGLLAVLVAGTLGGALVGVGESLLLTVTLAPAEEYWMFLFAVVAYGLLGAGVGLGAALGWQILRFGRADESEVVQPAIAAAVAMPALIVGQYRVSQYVFQEGLSLSAPGGKLAYGLIVIGGVGLAFLGVVLVRRCYRAAGTLGPLLALATVVGISILIGATAGTSTSAPATRPTATAGESRPPNIVLFVADTLRADAVDWEADHPSSPGGFARLARDGVVFERAYSQASWTRPSVASILTGQYPSTHGTRHKMDTLAEEAVTLAETLKQQGYWTAAFTTNINMAPKFNLNQGFDEYIYKPPAYYFGATDSAFELSIYKALRRVAEGPLAGPLVFQHYYQDAAVLGGAAAEWLAQDPPEPFFLFVHFMDSHDPYFEIPYSGRGVARVRNPTPKVDDIPVLLNFYGQEARYIDEQVKSLLARLAASGRYERSIVALTADHGEEFHEHGSWWHGTSLYEEQVRVPLVIKRPDVAMAGQRRDDIARTIDIAPTVLNAAGLEALDSHQGVDLFTSGVDEPLFAEEELKGYKLQSIRTGPWKLITANPDNDRGQAPLELYNLDEDPGEQNNLAAEETLRLEQMEQQLRAFHAEIARD